MPSGELGKVVISSKKEDLWLKRMRECSNEMYSRLSGKLLTTLEVALPATRQLEAFKERVKDIHGELSDSMDQNGYSIFDHYFMVSDEPQKTAFPEEDIQSRIREYQRVWMEEIGKRFFEFGQTLTNLVEMAVDEDRKVQALSQEIHRIVKDCTLKLRGWLGRGINQIFLGED